MSTGAARRIGWEPSPRQGWVAPHIAAWIDSVASTPKSALIAFGNPYILRQFPRARTYINAFGVGDALETAMARALAGQAPIGGKTPVSLPGFFARGDGISRNR